MITAKSCKSMGPMSSLIFAISFISTICIHRVDSWTNPNDVNVLQVLYGALGSPGQLSSWRGDDPCLQTWLGVKCGTDGRMLLGSYLGFPNHDPKNSSIILNISWQLNNLELSGNLPSEIGNLTALTNLDLSYNPGIQGLIPPEIGKLTNLTILNLVYCGFTGPIPPSLGDITQLKFLQLTGNGLTGNIPPELGRLKKVYWFDLSDNKLSGAIPVSPGLDELPSVYHFHFNNNSLSGPIPPQLGNLPKLWHLVVDNNSFSGPLPPELSKLSTLSVLRLNFNNFSGGLPREYGMMPNLLELSARNAGLTGTIPRFLNASNLLKLDLSSNRFSGTMPHGLGKDASQLQTLNLRNSSLSGFIDPTIANLRALQALYLSENNLEGNIPSNLGSDSSLMIVDLRNNRLTGSVPSALIDSSTVDLRLSGNPLCNVNLIANSTRCQKDIQLLASYRPISLPCGNLTCDPNSAPNPAAYHSEGKCVCAYPATVVVLLTGTTFMILTNDRARKLGTSIAEQLNLRNPWQCVLNSATRIGVNLQIELQFFPEKSTEKALQPTVVDKVTRKLATPQVDLGPDMQTYVVLSYKAPAIGEPKTKSNENLSGGAVIGIVVGCLVATAILGLLVFFAFKRRMRQRHDGEESKPFRYGNNGNNRLSWSSQTDKRDSIDSSVHVELKGVRWMSFEELSDATNNFSENCSIGIGSYGKVYKGVLRDNQVVAIKRRSKDSLQTASDFHNEIAILSRVHHMNLLNLLGYCDEKGEQMLVYKFMAQGSVHDQLSENHGEPLSWVSRLQIALGAARGLSYLHEAANPPIIHGDVKSSNILVDEKTVAKVADYGLKKLAPVDTITTVKGSPDYLDPEYSVTHKLTEKSDVYSFGMVLLELLTGYPPDKGIISEVKEKIQSRRGLCHMICPTMGPYSLDAITEVVYIAIRCVNDESAKRPDMSEVVEELEAALKNELTSHQVV